MTREEGATSASAAARSTRPPHRRCRKRSTVELLLLASTVVQEKLHRTAVLNPAPLPLTATAGQEELHVEDLEHLDAVDSQDFIEGDCGLLLRRQLRPEEQKQQREKP
jgi:hypothetical protein